MPAFYAHYRFGCEALEIAALEIAAPSNHSLPSGFPAIQALCRENRALFDIGLHGPDLFFFYRPILPNRVNRIGHEAHHRSGREFLARGKKVIAAAKNKAAARAYLYGLLCHFALDSLCHPYVAEAMATYGVTHAAVETAFDRALLTRDGIDPLTFDPCGHFETTRRNAAVIAPFYPPAVTDIVEKSLNSMVFYGRVLYCRNKALRAVIDKGLYVTLHHDAIADMMMTEKRDTALTESDARMYALYEEALALAQKLLCEADSYLESGKPAGPDFDKTFEG